VKNKTALAFGMNLMAFMFTGYYWAPFLRVMETLGFKDLVFWIPLSYGSAYFFSSWFYTKKVHDPKKWIFFSALVLSAIMVGMCAVLQLPAHQQGILIIALQGLFGLTAPLLFSGTDQNYRDQLSDRSKAHQRGSALFSTISPVAYLAFSTLSFWVLAELPVYLWVTLASLIPLTISLLSFRILPEKRVQKQREKLEKVSTEKKPKEPLLPVFVLMLVPYTLAGFVLGFWYLQSVVLWAALATPVLLVLWFLGLRLIRKKNQIQQGEQLIMTPRLFWLVLMTKLPNILSVQLSALYVPILLRDVTLVSTIMAGSTIGVIAGSWIAALIPAQYNRQTLTVCILMTGIGLTMVSVNDSPAIVFIALFLNATSNLLMFTILNQVLFKQLKQKSGAAGTSGLADAMVYLMVFILGWTTHRFHLSYQDLWGLQLILVPPAGIALHYLSQYFHSEETQTWKECRNELMQPIVKVIRSLALVFYMNHPAKK
jgi:hypothetical protein